MFLLDKKLTENDDPEKMEFERTVWYFVFALFFVMVLCVIKQNYDYFCIERKREKYYEEIDGKNSEEAELLTQSIINIPR